MFCTYISETMSDMLIVWCYLQCFQYLRHITKNSSSTKCVIKKTTTLKCAE